MTDTERVKGVGVGATFMVSSGCLDVSMVDSFKNWVKRTTVRLVCTQQEVQPQVDVDPLSLSRYKKDDKKSFLPSIDWGGTVVGVLQFSSSRHCVL